MTQSPAPSFPKGDAGIFFMDTEFEKSGELADIMAIRSTTIGGTVMKKNSLFCVSVLLLILLASASDTSLAQVKQPFDPSGTWRGVLEPGGGGTLRIVFRMTKDAYGNVTAKMDSPDQGVEGIGIERVWVNGDSLTLEIRSIGGAYRAVLSDSVLKGRWEQSGAMIPLVVRRAADVPGLERPQTPRQPYPYENEEVRYENRHAGITLTGTLSAPREGRPFPAVLLITGSGSQDRDETIFGHKPFLILADYLTRRGVAVLRVDDRGVGGSTGSAAASTTEDFASDVTSGIEYLKTRKEIDPKRIGLLGHSEGGIIAPMVASRSPDVAFIVLLAGTGLTGEEILYLQDSLIEKLSGVPEDKIREHRAQSEEVFRTVRAEKDTTELIKKLRTIVRRDYESLSPEEKKAVADPDKLVEQQVRGVASPWLRFFLTYDPRPVLKKVKCPVLAIAGEKDLQVPAKINLAEIEKALRSGGNVRVTVRELPGLNHLFQKAETGLPAEYGKITETISPDALTAIGDWIVHEMMH